MAIAVTTLTQDEYIRMSLRNLRRLNEDFQTNQNNLEQPQNNPTEKDEVVIDKNDEKFQELSNNITQFVGALKVDDKAEIVYPKDSDVVFNGVITDLNNLKFQFRYNDQSGGLYIWADSVLLTRETTEKLAKLVLIREQWKDYWASTISQYTQQNKPE
jgi:hypothetical protein